MWIIVLLAGFLGGWFFFEGLLAGDAPGQAVGAARGVAAVVIPYCMARSIQFLRGEWKP